MHQCYVALGANLGNPTTSIKKAFQSIAAHPKITDSTLSPIYETTPVSPIPQPNFFNAACTFKTSLPPLPLFNFLEEIESELGKRKKLKEAPRLIDLDLIFYGDLIYESDYLTIPHPRWDRRAFVLRPLADLTDDFNVLEKLNHVEDVCLSQLSPDLVS